MSNHVLEMVVDFSRCIGCMACVAGCSECHTHRGTPMIHVDTIEPGINPQTSPMICMHCVEPTCALSCPADAIKVDENGIVHSSLKPRCIACNNCELSCPFGVPRIRIEIGQMQKCDMCFDRVSVGKRPMCATVCPSGALFYGTKEQIEAQRPNSQPINKWRFGNQSVETRVWVMAPHGTEEMVIDWEPIPGPSAGGPAELAIRLKQQAERSSPPRRVETPPSAATITAAPGDGEVFFL